MTYYITPVDYHEIPEAYARQTLARAEQVYGYDGPDPDYDDDPWFEWAIEQDERRERYVDYSDVRDPDVPHITATNGHVWHVAPAAYTDYL